MLRKYVRNHLRCDIRAMETGGGGDCLFHSCATALGKMLHSVSDPEAAQHVLAKFPSDEMLHRFTSKERIVQCLRELAARGFQQWSPEAFLDYVVRAATDNRLGSFEDSWDPEELLLRCGFECLLDENDSLAESVLAFEEKNNGDAVLRVAFTDSTPGAGPRVERVHCVSDGVVKYWTLVQELQAHHAVLGNWHWGTQNDVRHLSSALDVGILMFCDRLHDNSGQCLYNIGSEREDFPYWIALWWQEPVHFRLAEVAVEGAEHTLAHTCFWSASDLPQTFLAEYRRCNRLAN